MTGAEITGETIRVMVHEIGVVALVQQLKPQLPEGFDSPRCITAVFDGGRTPTNNGWKEPRPARFELQARDGRTHTLGLTRICSAERFWELLEPLLDRFGAKLAFVGEGALWILSEAPAAGPTRPSGSTRWARRSGRRKFLRRLRGSSDNLGLYR